MANNMTKKSRVPSVSGSPSAPPPTNPSGPIISRHVQLQSRAYFYFYFYFFWNQYSHTGYGEANAIQTRRRGSCQAKSGDYRSGNPTGLLQQWNNSIHARVADPVPVLYVYLLCQPHLLYMISLFSLIFIVDNTVYRWPKSWGLPL